MKLPWFALFIFVIVSCNSSTEYEFYSGEFPPHEMSQKTMNMWDAANQNLSSAQDSRIALANAKMIYNEVLSICKNKADKQGWEEYMPNRWRRESNESR